MPSAQQRQMLPEVLSISEIMEVIPRRMVTLSDTGTTHRTAQRRRGVMEMEREKYRGRKSKREKGEV